PPSSTLFPYTTLFRSLASLEGVERPGPAAWTTRMSWFVYVVRLAPRHDRDRLIRELEARGVPARPYFPPIHLQPFYRGRFDLRPDRKSTRLNSSHDQI